MESGPISQEKTESFELNRELEAIAQTNCLKNSETSSEASVPRERESQVDDQPKEAEQSCDEDDNEELEHRNFNFNQSMKSSVADQHDMMAQTIYEPKEQNQLVVF